MKKASRAAAGRLVGAVAAGLVAWQLLSGAQQAAEGVRQALAVCSSILIPSLFPFMVLAALLPATAAGRLAAAPLGPVARLFYRLPRSLAPALLMSWIGGYPAGARALAELVDRGELSSRDAGRALCCLVNSGPAFMVTVVGSGIFGSPKLGLQLFACQLVAGAITGALLGVELPPRRRETAPTADKPFAEALVSAVTSAAAAMLSICAFVLVMGAIQALLQAGGAMQWAAVQLEQLSHGGLGQDAARVLLGGLLEICGGCASAATLTPLQALLVLPFMLSFGGVSVICQVAAVLGGRGVPLGRFVFSRLVHGALTQAVAYPLLYKSCAAASVGFITTPVLQRDPRTTLGVVLLVGVCALLCLLVEQGRQA